MCYVNAYISAAILFVRLESYLASAFTRHPFLAHKHHVVSTHISQSVEVQIEGGPFQPSQLADHWGRQPILIRNAFDPSILTSTGAWPGWDDIQSWACYGDDESDEDQDDYEKPVMSRLIRRNSEQLDSFTLELGPFEESYLQDVDGYWTLLLNDVDRIHSPLNDWMNNVFGPEFFPQWRMDDGQISIANNGGGIGPHVDNYDVFLIQTSGSREWLLGDYISTEKEMDDLIVGLEVRILDLGEAKPNNSVVVLAGDLLYLPPRLVHHGSALSDDCMTLSVGFRAPSATELVSRVAEHLSYSVAPAAVKRYTDNHLLETNRAPDDEDPVSITDDVKGEMKRLALDAVRNILDDPFTWDEIVGCLTTEPKRPTETFSIYEEGVVEETPAEHVQAAIYDGEGALWPSEGVALATSEVADGDYARFRVFADGQMFEWKTSNSGPDFVQGSKSILCAVKNRLPLTQECLGGSQIGTEASSVLEDLLQEGFYYYYDDED